MLTSRGVCRLRIGENEIGEIVILIHRELSATTSEDRGITTLTALIALEAIFKRGARNCRKGSTLSQQVAEATRVRAKPNTIE